jgi:DNA processing protein
MLDRLPWLALRSIPGVGVVLFHRLVQACGSPAAVFEAEAGRLRGIRGITPAMIQAIRAFRDWDRLEAELASLKAAGVEVVTQTQPHFPARLRQIPLAPPYLFVKGELLPQDEVAVALVGTRVTSYYGLKTCRGLAGDLADRGVTVVSGLARGIDTAAHLGALERGGRTLAVLGCGLDVVYPPENRGLYERIPAQGALISEFPLGTPPEAKNFPIRNRIISGLALGVVVVEAGEKSGANITAEIANEQGREVFAVPGPVNAPTSAGPHRLIQQGAKLVRQVADILDELPVQAAPAPQPQAAPAIRLAETAAPPRLTPPDPLLPFLGAEPLPLDELVQLCGLPAHEVLSRLTLLELQGFIQELPGKCYILS